MTLSVCVWCSDIYQNENTHFHNTGFCSDECRSAYIETTRDGVKEVEKTSGSKVCAICYSLFHGEGTLCSLECKQIYCESHGCVQPIETMHQSFVYDRNPINQFFVGSHFHHLHIEGNDTIGIYIPDELHRKYNHGNWRQDPDKLKKMNDAAFLWLCNQEIILGDEFNPDAMGTYEPRSKSHPISLKNKKLRDEFVIEQKLKGFKNADQMIRHLLVNAVDQETLGRLNEFIQEHNIKNPKKSLYNISNAIDYAIVQAEKVPGLEKKIRELEEGE